MRHGEDPVAVAAGRQETAALIGLQQHVGLGPGGHERHLDLVHPVRAGARAELDLLVERQPLRQPAQRALLQVGPAEPEVQLGQRVQYRLLALQRVHGDRVQVGGVQRAGDLQLGVHPDGHPVQALPEHGRDRGLPGDVQGERHGEALPGHQLVSAAELRPVEDHLPVALAVVGVLHLDAGGQPHPERLHVLGHVAGGQVYLTGQLATGEHVRVGQLGLDRAAAHTEAGQELLEHVLSQDLSAGAAAPGAACHRGPPLTVELVTALRTGCAGPFGTRPRPRVSDGRMSPPVRMIVASRPGWGGFWPGFDDRQRRAWRVPWRGPRTAVQWR